MLECGIKLMPTELFYPGVQHTNVQSQIFMNINQNKLEVIEKLQKN